MTHPRETASIGLLTPCLTVKKNDRVKWPLRFPEKIFMPLLALAFLLIAGSANASQVTCGCEWNPWTRVTYLSCAELRPNGHPIPRLSQQPFDQESECKAEASRAEAALLKAIRDPASRENSGEVSCDCDWNPWRANFLLSCTAWKGEAPSVRILDRMPFGGPKGRRDDAEKSCFAAKSSIETFAQGSR